MKLWELQLLNSTCFNAQKSTLWTQTCSWSHTNTFWIPIKVSDALFRCKGFLSGSAWRTEANISTKPLAVTLYLYHSTHVLQAVTITWQKWNISPAQKWRYIHCNLNSLHDLKLGVSASFLLTPQSFAFDISRGRFGSYDWSWSGRGSLNFKPGKLPLEKHSPVKPQPLKFNCFLFLKMWPNNSNEKKIVPAIFIIKKKNPNSHLNIAKQLKL